MSIVKHVSHNDFIDSFISMDRGNQFSFEALEALYEYYDNYSDEIGEEVQLDVIAICCDWTEASEEEIKDMYNIDADEEVVNYLGKHTYYIELSNNNILFNNF